MQMITLSRAVSSSDLYAHQRRQSSQMQEPPRGKRCHQQKQHQLSTFQYSSNSTMMPFSFYICKSINQCQSESVFQLWQICILSDMLEPKWEKKKWLFSSPLVNVCFPWKFSQKFEVGNFRFVFSQIYSHKWCLVCLRLTFNQLL